MSKDLLDAVVRFAKRRGVETDRVGRVKVLPDLSIPGHPEVFVVGDLMVLEQDGKAFSPGLAPVAIQQVLTSAN
jgi:NADH:ubiquinone reductase (H+-translocating)